MGIYDKKRNVTIKPRLNLNFRFGFKDFKYPMIAIGGIILLIIAFFALQMAFQPKPIIAVLSPNPLDLITESTTAFTVDVFNTTDSTASNAILKISPIASEMFVITPETKTISTFESGGRRQFIFQIRPFNKNNPAAGVPAGDYKINIVLAIDGKEFIEEVVLQVKRVS